MAVTLLLAIAAVLAWGTIYEARFGTAAVQRFLYRSWWFQGCLGFLAVNLAIAALERYPWQRRHLPFVLAHLGIILILLGGMLGGRFGIDGQLVIPEGTAARTLQLSTNVLVVREPNPGVDHVFPTQFEAAAWVHEPQVTFHVPLERGPIELTVDRYYPNATAQEEVTDDGPSENPALQVTVSREGQHDAVWLFARDPERFGARWGEAHVLFLEPSTEQQVVDLLQLTATTEASRGIVSLTVPGDQHPHQVPVPDPMDQRPTPIADTSYVITFKDYFPDFAITADGPTNRSNQPNNPAVSFLLNGPEGTDAHLLFANHPAFEDVHGLEHKIPAHVRYLHPERPTLPSQAITFVRAPSGALAAVLTGSGAQRQTIDVIELSRPYDHPWLGYQFAVNAFYPRARVSQAFTNRDNEVKAEALHLIGRDGAAITETWLSPSAPVTLSLGGYPLTVEYRPDERELPFTVTLLDFRKTEYPGTRMPAAFESDVELFDPRRGMVLMRTIRMNHPLRYRGFSLYQSSYIPGPPSTLAGAGEGPTETTVLSVRNDPGTPFVYAGFIIVLLGVVSMFVLRVEPPSPDSSSGTTR